MPALARRAPQLAPVTYSLEQWEIPGFPGVMIFEASLNIDIDSSGDWFIDHIWIGDEKREGRPVDPKEPLHAMIEKGIYADPKAQESILEACIDAGRPWI
jgi:hypothetical protein